MGARGELVEKQQSLDCFRTSQRRESGAPYFTKASHESRPPAAESEKRNKASTVAARDTRREGDHRR